MTVPDFPTVEYHLRRLDGDALAAFVADLWAARGYETAREGDIVLASHGSETIRIGIGPGSVSRASDVPEVIVAPDGAARVPDGARIVDATALAEMLGYAVDRSVARTLCTRHLGAPPGNLPVPRSIRVRRQTATLARGSPVVSVALVALLVVAGLAGAAVLSDPGGGAEVVTPDASVATPQPVEPSTGGGAVADRTTTDSAASDGTSADSSLPPGVTASGIENVTLLAKAHERAVSDRSYTIWVDWYRPESLRPNGTRVQRDIDIEVENDRYLIVTTEETDSDRTRLGALYHDGYASYAAAWDEENATYGRVFRIDPRQNVGPTPERVRERIVTRYLSTPTTEVTGPVEKEGRRLYRITGSGPPDTAASVTFRTYSVEALVDSSGFVRELSLEATVDHPDASEKTFRIRREITYDRVGETTVLAPEWYERETETDEE